MSRRAAGPQLTAGTRSNVLAVSQQDKALPTLGSQLGHTEPFRKQLSLRRMHRQCRLLGFRDTKRLPSR